MKKFLLMFCLLVSSILAQAQVENDKFIYAELVGTKKLLSSKVTVNIDFGQPQSFWNPHKNTSMLDENGKRITFNSMVDAMNYMGAQGWEFTQAYTVTEGQINVYHWLLKKNVNSFEESDEILKGLKELTKNKK